MLCHLPSAATFFTLLIIAARSKVFHGKSPNVSFPDIRKFLNTPEPIWTYNSTREESLPCTVDVRSKLDKDVILYNRSFYMRKQVRTEVLEGWFEVLQRDKMFVAVLDTIPVIAEVLVYANKTGRCGVFRSRLLFPGEHPWYDLRVKNSSILAGPLVDCSNYFINAHAKATSKIVQMKGSKSAAPAKRLYHPWCQRLLRRPSVLQPHPVKGAEHL
ncbi:uncharacterized protein LOC119373908 [Rhipicephalus sanguineus]|uniref:uncharacterized protein LOC119373908 n=1 Tax=Rhipicephalus sanguineus TaxID=34632 RepID=UPI0018938D3D|nr:uncharacterized protein LOC119373908 [Rhipicephalus sanguineus]